MPACAAPGPVARRLKADALLAGGGPHASSSSLFSLQPDRVAVRWAGLRNSSSHDKRRIAARRTDQRAVLAHRLMPNSLFHPRDFFFFFSFLTNLFLKW